VQSSIFNFAIDCKIEDGRLSSGELFNERFELPAVAHEFDRSSAANQL